MKRSIFLLIPAILFFSCAGEKNGTDSTIDSSVVNVSQSASNSNTALPEIKFEEEVHDFGKITQGERVKWSFRFTNTGKANLVISNVSTTCGCTIADYPKDPIAPGKDGKIEVEFNSESKEGLVERKVTVVSNCEPNSTTLTVKSEVIIPESKYSTEVK